MKYWPVYIHLTSIERGGAGDEFLPDST